MSINLQTGSYAPVLPGASSTDIQVVQKQSIQYPDVVPTPGDSSPSAPQDPEQQRYQHVANTAQGFISNPYPVSDKSFTIFKASDGQYVTRYTSLRDGKVTYVPELKMVQLFGPGQAQNQQTNVHIKA